MIYDLSAEDLPSMTWEEIRMYYVNAVDLPMVRLLSNPGKYDGKEVTTCGVYRHEFEATAIYLNRESYEYGLSENAVFAFTDHTDEKLLEKMDGNYVCMTGVFDAQPASRSFRNSGHLRDVAPMRMANVRFPLRRAAEEFYSDP
jgi:hypothetical protein